jgi:uncharacterized protein YbjT (DUF2867 family)
VFLSVAGAERNVVVPHHRVERHLRRDPIGWTVLRPSFFAQNLSGAYRDDIRGGRIVVPAGDGKVASSTPAISRTSPRWCCGIRGRTSDPDTS